MSWTDRGAAEQAYAFFHQKEKIYSRSASEREKDHIEESIASYVNAMSPELYHEISGGDSAFLMEHPTFADNLRAAVLRLEKML